MRRRAGFAQGLQTWVAIGLLLVLAACGGGGGGGGGGGAGSSAPPAPAPAFSVERTSVSFNLEEGDDTPAPLAIAGSITGVNEPVFLFVEYTNRGVAFASVSLSGSTTGRLDLTPRGWQQMSVGTVTDTVTVRACFDTACARPVAGSPQVISVVYTLRAAPVVPALSLSTRGVALAKTSGSERLVGTVRVSDNSSDTSNWSASTDASWLRITPSGRSGESVRVEASPVGLSPGQYTAVVSVRSDNARVTEAPAFRVGLYVAASAAATGLADAPTSALPFHDRQRREPVADPIRPLLYEMRNSEIVAHHFYTGQVTARWSLAGGTVLGLAVADDGRELYALLQGGEVAVIDLDSGSVLRRLPVAGLTRLLSNFDDGRLAQIRLDGRSVLLFNGAGMTPSDIGALPVLDPVTGARLGELRSNEVEVTGRALVPSEDRRFVYAETRRGADFDLAQLRLVRNSSGRVFGRVVAQCRSAPRGAPLAVPGGGVLWGFERFASAPEGLNLANSPLQTFFGDRSFPVTLGARLAYGGDGRLMMAERPFTGSSDGPATLYLFAADGRLLRQWQDTRLESFNFFNTTQGLVLALSSDGLRAQGNGQLINLGP